MLDIETSNVPKSFDVLTVSELPVFIKKTRDKNSSFVLSITISISELDGRFSILNSPPVKTRLS